MAISNTELSKYPALYKTVKGIALITFLIGAFTVIDFYLPSDTKTTQILDTEVKEGNANDLFPHRQFLLITRQGIIEVEPKYSDQIHANMTLEIHTSRIYSVLKRYVFYENGQKQLEVAPENIFALDALFAKILLLSIFTLIYTHPKYWMIAISLINVIIAIIFSGIPKLYIVLILIAGATIAFSISLYIGMQQEKRRQME